MTRPTSFAAAFLLAVAVTSAAAQDLRVRRRPLVPDIPGYKTLLCDLHTHTVFSDGKVWPDVRAEEAWREGLDAIAITDHIEYQPHRADLPTNHERSWQIAAPHGQKLDLIVIRGSEVTRKMPPGHLNAIFLKSSAPLDKPEWMDALRAARAQGAFLFWNHPGWRGHQRDGVSRWYPEHDEILAAGLMDGIEVVNERDYYPEAHRWAIEKNLTPLASSDIHEPLNMDYDVASGDHRPTTLVFARERTSESIREALLARRTAAWSGTLLIGRMELVRPLIAAALTIENPKLNVARGDDAFIRVRNDSDFLLELTAPPFDGPLRVPESVVLKPRGTSLISVRAPSTAELGKVRLDLAYTITNVRTAPGVGLPHRIAVDVEVVPAAE